MNYAATPFRHFYYKRNRELKMSRKCPLLIEGSNLNRSRKLTKIKVYLIKLKNPAKPSGHFFSSKIPQKLTKVTPIKRVKLEELETIKENFSLTVFDHL